MKSNKKNKSELKDKKLDMKTKFSKFTIIFLIGSISGFIYEEIFCLLFDHELVKRGFLYGPYLPVYGFGALFLMIILKKFKKSPFIVFILGMIITGIVEYITGYGLWKIYHRTWWDYTGLFLNINGYVCLRSVLTFAIGGFLLIYLIEPYVCKIVKNIKQIRLVSASFIIIFTFITDFIMTILFRNTI